MVSTLRALADPKMREALGRLNTELYPPLKETGFSIRSNALMPESCA